MSIFAEAMNRGENLPGVEYRIIHKNGDIRWVRNTPVLLYNRGDRSISYDGMIADISAEPEKTSTALAHGFDRISLRYHRKKDGTIFPVEVTGNLLRRGETECYITFMRDITETIYAQESIRVLNENLEKRVAERTAQLDEAVKKLEKEIAWRSIDSIIKSDSHK